MSTRITPSLNWLIEKRARLSAEIHKTRKSLDKAEELINELKELEGTLAAIDITLGLHELQIDKTLIRLIRSQYIKLKIPYGEINRSVLTCLKLYDNGYPVPVSEITNFVIARHFNPDEISIPLVRITRSVHQALNRLNAKGQVIGFHDPKSNKEGIWKLNNSDE